jgi:hypothetical protein
MQTTAIVEPVRKPHARRRSRIAGEAIVLLLATLLISPALAGESIKSIFKDGEFSLDLRYRFEKVDDDLLLTEDAEASTLRLRAGYKTGTYYDFQAYMDFEHLLVIGDEAYNSTANGLTEFSTVADPDDTELNQAYLSYVGWEDYALALGRQRITLDNHRFVGNVGWRQLEQTFDAFSAKGEPFENFKFFYGHLNNANRVFGEHNPNPFLSDTDLFGDLLNVSYTFSFATVTAYGYFLELEDLPMQSHRSIGLRFAGDHAFTDDLELMYAAEYADQADYKDAPSGVDASYVLGELGLGFWMVTAKVGYELLEGDGTFAFQTPLATLHKFNGWADQFLATPPNGLQDAYVSVGAKVKGINLLGVYHRFEADEGDMEYGTELDLLASKTFKKVYSVMLKYAGYSAEDLNVDTEKIWVGLQFKI